jgi:hypothetical protein
MKSGNVLLGAIVLLIVATLGIQQWQLRQRLAAVQTELTAQKKPASDPAVAPASADEIAELRGTVAQQNVRIAELERRLETFNRPGEQITRPRADLLPPLSDPNIGTSPKRSWGPEQAAGAPDTHAAGDIPTAWASREPDAGLEWLKLDYERVVEVAQIRVRETHNPGAITKAVAVLDNGAETVLWEGVEPTVEPPIEMEFNTLNGVYARAIKLYLDTARVPGWNEIDAVELIGRDGSRQWAKSASASSTYVER